jgi:cyclic pyranopterin phosphate synthase
VTVSDGRASESFDGPVADSGVENDPSVESATAPTRGSIPGVAAEPAAAMNTTSPVAPATGPDADISSLTHVDATGAARMVDVSEKEPTSRTALATGVLRTTPQVIDLLRQNGLPKGDALATARVAGIMAAKRTPDLIPLCHPIAISAVAVELSLHSTDVRISATVRTTDRTGVEMEALTAVAVAGLTLHDMIKAVDPAAVLGEIKVERKDGGKTGSWVRPDGGQAGPGARPDGGHTGPGAWTDGAVPS